MYVHHACMQLEHNNNNKCKYACTIQTGAGAEDAVASWNVTKMMTRKTAEDNQKEVERKARLLELNSEVFGKETTEAKNTFIEVIKSFIHAWNIITMERIAMHAIIIIPDR